MAFKSSSKRLFTKIQPNSSISNKERILQFSDHKNRFVHNYITLESKEKEVANMFSSTLKEDTKKTIDEVAETKKIHEKEIATLLKYHDAKLKKHEQEMSSLLKRQATGTLNLLNNGDSEKVKEL